MTVAFAEGMMIKDDGSAKPDLKVTGSGDAVGYVIAVRRPDGNYQVIDRAKAFGPADMNHHKVLETDAVKIINTGAAELLVDSIEALRPLTPR